MMVHTLRTAGWMMKSKVSTCWFVSSVEEVGT
jgi:hypothetical protein